VARERVCVGSCSGFGGSGRWWTARVAVAVAGVGGRGHDRRRTMRVAIELGR
jgi:hypothetical protein